MTHKGLFGLTEEGQACGTKEDKTMAKNLQRVLIFVKPIVFRVLDVNFSLGFFSAPPLQESVNNLRSGCSFHGL